MMEESVAAKYENDADLFDERKYIKVMNPSSDEKPIPTPEDLKAYITKIFREAEVGEEVIVMAMVYLKRLTECADLRLHPNNWRLMILSCFMLASKVWEEEAVWNEDFLSLFPAISVNKFAALELEMLNTMQFNVCVKASTYAEAYFALTALSDEKRDWKSKPLSRDEARDLEIRTLGLETKSKAKKAQAGSRRRGNSDATHTRGKTSSAILG